MACHRGANLIAPEDTLAAVRAAFELGADFVEIDVRNSVDLIADLISAAPASDRVGAALRPAAVDLLTQRKTTSEAHSSAEIR